MPFAYSEGNLVIVARLTVGWVRAEAFALQMRVKRCFDRFVCSKKGTRWRRIETFDCVVFVPCLGTRGLLEPGLGQQSFSIESDRTCDKGELVDTSYEKEAADQLGTLCLFDESYTPLSSAPRSPSFVLRVPAELTKIIGGGLETRFFFLSPISPSVVTGVSGGIGLGVFGVRGVVGDVDFFRLALFGELDTGDNNESHLTLDLCAAWAMMDALTVRVGVIGVVGISIISCAGSSMLA